MDVPHDAQPRETDPQRAMAPICSKRPRAAAMTTGGSCVAPVANFRVEQCAIETNGFVDGKYEPLCTGPSGNLGECPGDARGSVCHAGHRSRGKTRHIPADAV